MQKNGRKLNGEELEEEREKEVEFREKINNRQSYVVSFKPDQSKDLPVDKDVDLFLNAFAGTVWIDRSDFEIVRVKGGLIRTIRIGLGLLAYFKKANLVYP